MDRKLEEQMYELGLHENVIGGHGRLEFLGNYFGATIVENAAPVEPVVEAAPEATAAVAAEAVAEPVEESDDLSEEDRALLESLYGGENVTEEFMEFLESTDWSEEDDEVIEGLLDTIAGKNIDEQVHPELVDRMHDFLVGLQERKAFRIVKGKKNRVDVKVGGAKTRAHREYLKLMKKGGRRSKVRRQKRLRSKKSSAKMAASKTKRYHSKNQALKGTFTNKATAIVKKSVGSSVSSTAKKVKTKAGKMESVAPKQESALMSQLRNLLTESTQAETGIRDEIMVTLSCVAESLDVIYSRLDEDAADFMAIQFEELANLYLDGNLHEAKATDDQFMKQLGRYTRVMSECMKTLEKKF